MSWPMMVKTLLDNIAKESDILAQATAGLVEVQILFADVYHRAQNTEELDYRHDMANLAGLSVKVCVLVAAI